MLTVVSQSAKLWSTMRVLIFSVILLCRAADARNSALFPAQQEQIRGVRAKQILQVVCPGHVVQSGKGSDIAYGCNACPEEAPEAQTSDKAIWTVYFGISGHFTSPTADNLVLSMGGCEPHANNFGGSVLLTRQGGKWERDWYQAGALTQNCKKIALADKREILFCEGGYMGSGTVAETLYTLDLSLSEDKRLNQVILVEDTMGACFAGASLRRASIEKVEFPDLNGDGVPDLRVSVPNGSTKKFTDAEIRRLCPDDLPKPVLRHEVIDFHFRADHFEPTPAGQALLKRLQE